MLNLKKKLVILLNRQVLCISKIIIISAISAFIIVSTIWNNISGVLENLCFKHISNLRGYISLLHCEKKTSFYLCFNTTTVQVHNRLLIFFLES
jgi:hypothetical protein